MLNCRLFTPGSGQPRHAVASIEGKSSDALAKRSHPPDSQNLYPKSRQTGKQRLGDQSCFVSFDWPGRAAVAPLHHFARHAGHCCQNIAGRLVCAGAGSCILSAVWSAASGGHPPVLTRVDRKNRGLRPALSRRPCDLKNSHAMFSIADNPCATCA